MVQKAVARWRVGPRPRGRAAWGATGPASADLPPLRPPSPRQAVWLLLKTTTKLTIEQQRMGMSLLAAAPEVQTALNLHDEFRQMIRDRSTGVLDLWLARSEAN